MTQRPTDGHIVRLLCVVRGPQINKDTLLGQGVPRAQTPVLGSGEKGADLSLAETTASRTDVRTPVSLGSGAARRCSQPRRCPQRRPQHAARSWAAWPFTMGGGVSRGSKRDRNVGSGECQEGECDLIHYHAHVPHMVSPQVRPARDIGALLGTRQPHFALGF